MRPRIGFRLALALVAALTVWPGGRAVQAGLEVWTPQSGEVSLDAPPQEGVQQQLAHAYALVGAGRCAAGLAELRRLTEAHADAEWLPKAEFTMARAMLASGKAAEAFHRLERFGEQYPDHPLTASVSVLQFRAAELAAKRNVDTGVELYARLIETSEERQQQALAQKELADALFEARRYQGAETEYLALVTFYPESRWVPHAWFKAAQCEWRLARWLELGLQRTREAERRFRNFVQRFPGDPRTELAEQTIQRARRDRAQFNWKIARYYVDVERKPWAAMSYLELVRKEFPDNPAATWARREMQRIEEERRIPPRGRVKPLKLTGVVSAPESSAPAEAESTEETESDEGD